MSQAPDPATPIACAIPERLLFEVYRAARQGFPAECCGWLAGPRDRPDLVTRVVVCRNAVAIDSARRTEFRFDGPDLVGFSHAFDGALPPRVLFHSHPRGHATFSAVDRAAAVDPWGTPLFPVQHLVVALDDQTIGGSALFAWAAPTGFIQIASFPGAPLLRCR